ncbi:cytochrome P450 3A41 [Armadillidium vulgare]|nr:cytochrome P450 3A41 [Armadillidium vulgare]
MDSDRATFTKMASKIFVLSPLRALKVITLLVAPSLARLSQKLGLGFVSDEFQFFQGVVSKTLLLREEMGIRRGDFLDLMKDTNKLCETTMAAQSVLFLLAGFNNIASALSFTLHLLAKHPDIQQELRQKLMTISESKDEKIVTDFEALQKLPLLDCVVKESLRLYPTDPTMERTCTKDYQIPGSKVWIRAGQKVIIPIWCIHRDPIHWDNPNDFDPNRFSNISDRDFGPYFPFGLGPRQCIGLRFVNVVVKVGLHKILTNFEVLPSQNTIHPPPLSPKCLSSVMPLNGLPLSVIPLKSKK